MSNVPSSSPRGKLPTCVTKMRSMLFCMRRSAGQIRADRQKIVRPVPIQPDTLSQIRLGWLARPSKLAGASRTDAIAFPQRSVHENLRVSAPSTREARVEDVSPCKGHITVVGDQPGMLM